MDVAVLLPRALLTHRNALARISVLPPEVLSRIFRLVALAEPPPWSELQHLGWISVTHVCRHWRQAARVSGYRASTAWISETLARARNAPLAIFPAHFAHARESHLRGGLVTHHFDDNVRKICNMRVPALEHFELGVAVASPITTLGTPFCNGMSRNFG
jgi:hypothetical protein